MPARTKLSPAEGRIVNSGDAPEKISGVVVGKVLRIEEGGRTMVSFGGESDGEFSAMIAGSWQLRAGSWVALMFENGDINKPIIVGPIVEPPDTSGETEKKAPISPSITARQDRVVLRCGKSSITLTRSGQIILRGAYISSRSTGVNRIRGGSVHIN